MSKKLFTRPNLMRIIVGCVVGVLLILLEGIWINELPKEITGKLLLTLGLIAGAAGLGYAAAADIEADTKGENDKYLN